MNYSWRQKYREKRPTNLPTTTSQIVAHAFTYLVYSTNRRQKRKNHYLANSASDLAFERRCAHRHQAKAAAIA
jgi:hypothetical protein